MEGGDKKSVRVRKVRLFVPTSLMCRIGMRAHVAALRQKPSACLRPAYTAGLAGQQTLMLRWNRWPRLLPAGKLRPPPFHPLPPLQIKSWAVSAALFPCELSAEAQALCQGAHLPHRKLRCLA